MNQPSIDSVKLTGDPLDLPSAIAHVTDPTAGGIAVFLGTTRAEIDPAAGRQLLALDYEAYEAMALSQMNDLVAQARAKWPVVRCVLWHRTGRVTIGQPSVLIAVSTPHRAAAFDACRFLIDTLKAEVAVWKREAWTDGTRSWVPGTPVRQP